MAATDAPLRSTSHRATAPIIDTERGNRLCIFATPLDFPHYGWFYSDGPPSLLHKSNDIERARRAFIDALKQSALPPPPTTATATSLDDAQVSTDADDAAATSAYETKSEVESEKERREDDVTQLSLEADLLRKIKPTWPLM